jgi:hypothetical protein
MYELKDEVILRILVQESPKSELRLKRYGEKSFMDLFVISRKWLGRYLEIFSDSRGLFGKLVDCGLISDKNSGFFVRWPGFSGFGFNFLWKNP